MEKKILVTLSFVAAVCLIWVFSFLGEGQNNDFTHQAKLDMPVEPCAADSAVPCPVDAYRKPGFAVFRTDRTSYVLRPGQAGSDQVQKMRVQVEQPTAPMPASTNCERKRIDQLQALESPGFTIESLKVQRTDDWTEEYEIFYQRLHGNWSDFEATLHPYSEQDRLFFETVLKSHSAFVESEASI